MRWSLMILIFTPVSWSEILITGRWALHFSMRGGEKYVWVTTWKTSINFLHRISEYGGRILITEQPLITVLFVCPEKAFINLSELADIDTLRWVLWPGMTKSLDHARTLTATMTLMIILCLDGGRPYMDLSASSGLQKFLKLFRRGSAGCRAIVYTIRRTSTENEMGSK